MNNPPRVTIHPADHDEAKAYYVARNMQPGVDYVLEAGPERWPRIETRDEPYDRFGEL